MVAAAGPDTSVVTYTEVRWWAIYLDTFTASDLADAMAVSRPVAQRFIRALLWHGICEDTGDELDGEYGPESIISYIPLPPGPNEHETQTPVERLVGYTDVIEVRGMPVRIRTERDTRVALSTPGARHQHKMREVAWQRQQEAIRKRAEEAKRKDNEPKWLKKKKKQAKRANNSSSNGN